MSSVLSTSSSITLPCIRSLRSKVGSAALKLTEWWQLLHRSKKSRVMAWRRVDSKSFSCLSQARHLIWGSSFLASQKPLSWFIGGRGYEALALFV
jgi:hypothetical protein